MNVSLIIPSILSTAEKKSSARGYATETPIKTTSKFRILLILGSFWMGYTKLDRKNKLI